MIRLTAPVLLVVATLGVATATLAQTRTPDLTQEILAFREKVRSAVSAKDSKALSQFYADNFKHVRDTGRTDQKSERIAGLVAGEEGIETAAEEDIVIEAYGPNTAVATGLSPVKDARSGRSARYQWLTVYVRIDGNWRIAVSQATRYTARQ
jgi:hypothetical protein